MAVQMPILETTRDAWEMIKKIPKGCTCEAFLLKINGKNNEAHRSYHKS